MGSARPWFVLAVALVPAGASADNHFADVMGAGSGSAQSALGGVQVTAAFLLGKKPPDYHVAPKPRQWSLLADGTAYFVGTHEGEELKEFSYAAGVRRTLANRLHDKYLPFAHATFGGIHGDRGELKGTRAAFVVGGGCDYLTKRHESPDRGYTVLGARAQMEWVFPVSGESRDVFPRFSVGFVVRIGERFFGPPATAATEGRHLSSRR
jgi:hypothetical protein